MVQSLGLTTSFHKLGDKERERIERKGFELHAVGEYGNGVVMSKDWDPSRPTVLFCHGRDGSAGSSGYMNIPQEIAKHKFDGNCNIAIVLHRAPGDQNTMVADGLDAIDHLTGAMGNKNVRPQDLYIAGYSIGCITAAALANCTPQAARLTLLLPPTSIPEAAEYTFSNRPFLKGLKKMASWVTGIIDGNDRNTVNYIASMHRGAMTRGEPDVMPVEVLLSRDDKVADPAVFVAGVRQRGLYVEPGHADNKVSIAVEEMHNSPTAHTEAFSLDKNFPQLKGNRDILHATLPRVAPIRPIEVSEGRGR